MDQQTRMFKILAALAISMIGGALMLSGTSLGRSRSSPQHALLLRAAGVAEPVSNESPTRRFQESVVVAHPTSGRNLLEYKDLRDARRAHLIIGERGLIRVQPAWHRAERFERYGAGLVVRIDCPAQATELSPAQSDALALLLNRIRALPDLTLRRVRHESHHPAFRTLGDHLQRILGDNRAFSFAG